MTPRRVEVLGVPVDLVTMEQSLEIVDRLVRGDRCELIIAVNPEKVMRAHRDPEMLARLRNAALLIPDGIGVVWAARYLGLGRCERVPGSELMPAICERAAERGYRIFLFGAGPDVNALAKQRLEESYPEIRIVGTEHGYVAEDEFPDLVERINRSQADILFVGLGSPRQERWMERHRSKLRVKVCQGVGGTFDVIAGRTRRAPQLFLNMHLEWLYRLATQPTRFGRQIALARFVGRVVKQRFRP